MNNLMLEIRIGLLEAALIDSPEKNEHYLNIFQALSSEIIKDSEHLPDLPLLKERLEQHF